MLRGVTAFTVYKAVAGTLPDRAVTLQNYLKPPARRRSDYGYTRLSPVFQEIRMLRFTRSTLLCATLAAFPAAAETPKFGPELQGFHYPYPLQQFSFTSQGSR